MSITAPMAQATTTPRQPASVLALPPTKAGMPDAETAWRAVQARDRAFNGRFFFSVKSTGVYCLPSCAARPPLRRNVDFHASCEAAEAAGFRACKRCRPRDWQQETGLSRAVAQACRLLDAETEERSSLERIARKVGLTGSTLWRFQREAAWRRATGWRRARPTASRRR